MLEGQAIPPANRELDVAIQAARAGGRVLREWLGRISAREKGPKDFVTEADLAAQLAVQEILQEAFPEYAFLGEESDPADNQASEAAPCRWIVDPLDGTTNYVHGLHGFAVSIAWECQGEVKAGVIYDPLADECFTATAGGGAFLNGQPIRASSCTSLRSAMIAASFSANVTRDSVEIQRFVEILLAAQSLRRMGSAALNLSYLAVGRLDGYWATNVKIWDVAAGILLVQEAGGVVSNIFGGPFDLSRPEFAAAATGLLHAEFVATLLRRPGCSVQPG